MTTTKEIFDHLTAKYSGVEIVATEAWRNRDNEPHYFTVRVGDIFACTDRTPPNIQEMLDELASEMPTAQQKRQLLIDARNKAADVLAKCEAKLKV